MDFGAGQVGGAIHGLFNRRRSNRNQTSSPVPLHPRQSFPGKIDGAHQKLVECGAPGFRRDILKQVRRRTTGIGNADVQAAEASLYGGNEICNSLGISHIQRSVESVAARGFLNLRSGLF